MENVNTRRIRLQCITAQRIYTFVSSAGFCNSALHASTLSLATPLALIASEFLQSNGIYNPTALRANTKQLV